MTESTESTLVPLHVTKNPDHVFTYTFQTSPAAQLDLAVEFTLGKVRTWRSLDGVGTEAELKHNGRIIGTIGNEGTGDGVFYRPSVPYASGRGVVEVLIEDARQRRADGEFFIEETLWNDFLEEHETRKRLDRQFKGTKAKPGKTALIKNGTVRSDVNLDGFYYTEPRWWTTTSVPSAIDKVRAAHKNAGFSHYWDGEKWASL